MAIEYKNIGRDVEKERTVGLATFGENFGRMPDSTEDWDLVHQYTYGQYVPQELAPQNYPEQSQENKPNTLTEYYSQIPQNLQGQDTGRLQQLGQGVQQADQQAQQYQSPTAHLGMLEEAIKIKTGSYDAPLGESEIFKQAGVGGYGALMSSLSARQNEMKTNQAAFQNVLRTVLGTYNEKSSALSDKYDSVVEQYNDELDYLRGLDEAERKMSEEMDLYKQKAEIDQQLKKTQTYSPSSSQKDYSSLKAGGYKGTFEEAIKEGLIGSYKSNDKEPSLKDAILEQLDSNNARGSDNKISWETYLQMKQDWVNNGGIAGEFDLNFPIGEYLDSDNQQAYKNILNK